MPDSPYVKHLIDQAKTLNEMQAKATLITLFKVFDTIENHTLRARVLDTMSYGMATIIDKTKGV